MTSDARVKRVFISYVSENSDRVDDLCAVLAAAKIPYWRDRSELGPGDEWKVKIREAIRSGSIFLACFSNESRAKGKTHMNEEVNLAIEEGRKLPPGSTWMIPVRFDDGPVPEWELGPNKTLNDLNHCDLYGKGYAPNIVQLVDKIKEAMGLPAATGATAVRTLAEKAAAAEQRVDARSAARRDLSYTLAPILRRIANRAVENPASLRDQIPGMVVNAAAELIGPQLTTRSCFYILESGPPKRLVLDEHAGRPSPPGTQFAAGYPRGDAAIALVEQDDYLLCEDVDNEPPPNWSHDKDTSYKTFISVGVRTRATEWGMLTVDTPTPGDLNDLDVDFLRVLGGLIAAALSIAKAAGPVGGQQ